MRKHRNIIICTFLFVLLVACSNKAADTDFNLKANELSAKSLDVGDVFIRYPKKILLKDSVLYILDIHAVEYYCHQFKYPSMEHIQSFAKRGEGPEEFVIAENIRFNSNDDINILDLSRRKISLIDKNSKNRIKETDLSEKLIMAFDFDLYNDTTFIIPDYTGESRFCIVGENGQIKSKKFSIPAKYVQPDASHAILAQAWRPFTDYNEENGIYAMVTQFGEVLEIYDLKKDTLVNIVYGKSGEPQFIVKSGYAKPNGIMGYSDVCVGKDCIYAIFWGNSFEDMKNRDLSTVTQGGHYVKVFDLKGNFIKEYVLDKPITSMYLDEKNKKIIGLDVNSDQPVIEYTLN